MIWVILAILAIIAVLGYLVYTENINTVVEKTESAFNTITKGSPLEGFEIIHKTPKQPDQSNKIVVKEEPIYIESNGTLIEDRVETTIIEYDDKYPTYHVDNIPPIIGYIKLYEFSEPIKPYVYDYMISIECSEFGTFCNLKNTVNRGQTENGGKDEDGNDLGGYYHYDWSHFKEQDDLLPDNVDEVLYDITVFVDTYDSQGKTITESSTYTIRIVP